MEKIFLGQVIKSAPREFTGADGEVVELWELAILLTEDKGMTFNVSKRENMYNLVADIKVGEKVRCQAEPEIRMDGRVKWRLVLLSIVE